MRMQRTPMKALVVMYVILGISGCVSHDNLVRCDGRLQPINTPMLRPAESGVPASSGESAEARSDRE